MTSNPISTHFLHLSKQLLGAAVGGSLALSLYYGYEYGKPKLLAYINVPAIHKSAEIRVSDTDQDEETYARISARAKEIAENFKSREADPADYVEDETSGEIPETGTPATGAPIAFPVPDAAPPLAEDVVAESEAPELPDSGVPILAVFGTAIGATAMVMKKRG